MIRKATFLDKASILKFCENTFSWGDYIAQVWDSWISEDHLYLFEKQSPVGICHASYLDDQIWIEGIRIDPNFRREKIASSLILHAESIGKQKGILFSFLLTDTENKSSISLVKSLDYFISQTWNFYSLVPQKNLNYDVTFETSLNYKIYSNYVNSWRWLPININIINNNMSSFLCENKKIIKSVIHGQESVAILTDSIHFDRTLIVTLFSGSDDTALQIISFLQNYGIDKNYQRIQILTKESLPSFNLLEHKISFHLMKKFLS